MRKTPPTFGAAALSALALVAACSPAQAEPAKSPSAPTPKAPAAAPAPTGADFRYSKALPAGQTVSIRNIMGTIRAEPSSSGTLEVLATKVSEGGDPSLVRVVANEHGGGVTICALYPDSGDTCDGVGRGSRFQHRGNTGETKVRVDFVVRVPSGLAFEAANVSGDIEARGLKGDVRAAAVSGNVDVNTASGVVEAKSVSGTVRVTMGAPREGAASSASAVSGHVEVRLPAQSNFDAEATTVSGRIETDFGLPVQRGFVGQSLHGRVGRGGSHLKLDTVSGGIRISRS